MAISTKYDPASVEEKWYSTWMNEGYFKSNVNPEKEAYSIVIPPPNVTGLLHMGHMMNNTIQDVLVRRARMLGKEACWVPGTDHASIATETKVVKMLKEQGIEKSDLTRDEFLGHAFEWKEKYGGIILDQLKKLGASCDWDRTAFTMDEDRSEAVIDVFVDLYNKGYIYRGVRMVNWDPEGQTALSDEEVNHKEVQSKLYHVEYKIAGENNTLTIATTRPETILGDTAICVNPNDERYTSLVGKKAIVPLINREIPIIADEYVDMEFGTGCLKVTPAHDLNDYELGLKHNLESIDILNDDGTLNEKAQLLVGEDRFVARKMLVKLLKKEECFVKDEDITNNVGFSERTNAVIEPKLSTQWFCKMTDMAKPALDNVMNDEIQIHPPKFKNMYRSWMENVKDWCVSRQLWWGHQIPAYYLPNGQVVVATSAEEALAKAQEIDPSVTSEQLKQDEDVLDTWFSSWLWPISVFRGLGNDNEEIKFYYPTDDLVTGFDIIFFWVARMIMAGYEFKGEMPFKNVYITGMVRDTQGRKMSKQLGNSPDPLDLIAKYGADGVRSGLMLVSAAGNDLLFDEKLCQQGAGFANKIWNAYRLIDSWETEDREQEKRDVQAQAWIESRIAESLGQVEQDFANYRISDALMNLYKLVWDDFCGFYLESIKPVYQEKGTTKTKSEAKATLATLLKMLHPFMPFITEELWGEVGDGGHIIVSSWPSQGEKDQAALDDMALVQDLITGVRNVRAEKQLPKNDLLEIKLKTDDFARFAKYDDLIQWLAAVSPLEEVKEQVEGATSYRVKSTEVYIPLEGKIDVEAEKENIKKELEYTKGFLISVDKKLSNERFVSGAPEQVVANEKRKKADAEAKIKVLEESLVAMG